MKTMKSQQGFTLIELIVVIVILGILAVTAAPKFVDFASDANKSALAGVKGSIASANTVYNAKAAIDGNEKAPTATANGVNMVYGYPAASSAGVISAAGLSAATNLTSDFVYFDDATATPPTVHITSTNKLTTIAGAAATKAEITATNCYIVYTQAADASTASGVAITSTGC